MVLSNILVISLSVAFPAGEPSLQVAQPSSPYLSIDAPPTEGMQAALRLFAGYVQPQVEDGDRLNVLLSGLGGEFRVHDDLIMAATLLARVGHGNAQASLPDSATLSAVYQPGFLAQPAIRMLLTGNVTYGADVRWGTPGTGRVDGSMTLGAAGSVGGASWTAQGGFRMGSERLVEPGVRESPKRAVGALGASLPVPMLPLRLGLETRGEMSIDDYDDTRMISAVSLGMPFGLGAVAQLAGTITTGSRQEAAPGFMLMISSPFGAGDSDRDGVPDNEDACPTASGALQYQGCSLEDIDNDGVWDRYDACEDKPGPADNAGCPLSARNKVGAAKPVEGGKTEAGDEAGQSDAASSPAKD